MADLYSSGHNDGYGYATGDGSLSVDINNFNGINTFQQQGLLSQDALSPTTRPRNDPANSQLSPHALQSPAGQHQAGIQPRAAQLTPHISNAYPYRSEGMSRGTSHTSLHSSTSSGQQYSGSPHFVPHNSFPNIYSPNGATMQRSRSAYSNTFALNSQQFSLQPQMYQSTVDHYSRDPVDAFATNFSTTVQYSPPIASLDDPTINYDLSGLNNLGNDVRLFGSGSSE